MRIQFWCGETYLWYAFWLFSILIKVTWKVHPKWIFHDYLSKLWLGCVLLWESLFLGRWDSPESANQGTALADFGKIDFPGSPLYLSFRLCYRHQIGLDVSPWKFLNITLPCKWLFLSVCVWDISFFLTWLYSLDVVPFRLIRSFSRVGSWQMVNLEFQKMKMEEEKIILRILPFLFYSSFLSAQTKSITLWTFKELLGTVKSIDFLSRFNALLGIVKSIVFDAVWGIVGHSFVLRPFF